MKARTELLYFVIGSLIFIGAAGALDAPGITDQRLMLPVRLDRRRDQPKCHRRFRLCPAERTGQVSHLSAGTFLP